MPLRQPLLYLECFFIVHSEELRSDFNYTVGHTLDGPLGFHIIGVLLAQWAILTTAAHATPNR